MMMIDDYDDDNYDYDDAGGDDDYDYDDDVDDEVGGDDD